MANETPNHKYTVVSDNPKDGEDYATRKHISDRMSIVTIIPLAFIVLSIISNWVIVFWISVTTLCVLLVAVLSFRANYDKTSPRLKEAKYAKDFLGFDFGNSFTLRKTESHDYAEILLDFDETLFVPLMDFCKSQAESSERVDNKDEIVISEIKQCIETKNGEIPKTGFTKTESYHAPSLNTPDNLRSTSRLQCEVDYENRTLKMFYAGI